MNGASSLRRMAGVTLVEMLTVMVIVGILIAMGVPSFRSVTNSNRIAAEVNGLLGDLQFARAEAIKEGQTVTACVSADGAQCSNSTDWKTGWIVFSDQNNSATVDAGDAILRVQAPFSGTDTFQATNNVKTITFNREGLAIGIAGGTVIKLHDSTNTSVFTRCLSVTMIGQMESQKYGVSTCT